MQSQKHSLTQGKLPRSRRGSILVLALGIIALLSAILVAFLTESVARIKYFGLFFNRDDLRAEAYSTLEVTLAVLSELREIDGSLFGPVQGWARPLEYAEYLPPEGLQVSVRVEDETSRLPLNAMTDPRLIKAFFDVQGLGLSESQELTDCLIDWMDTDNNKLLNGFDGEDYESEFDPPYRPSNASIATWEELRLIYKVKDFFFNEDGLPNEYYNEFINTFSLYSTNDVNLNTANPRVLTLFAKAFAFDDSAVTTYLAGPDGELGTDDDRMFTGKDNELDILTSALRANGISYGFKAEMIKIEVSVTRGESNFLLTAIVSYKGADPGAKDIDRDQLEEEAERADEGKSRGGTARDIDMGKALGYPFDFVMLVENVKI